MSGAGALVQTLLDRLSAVDPGPLFVLSLLPYLAFLWWARQVQAFPRLALRGFQLTLLFVAITIGAAVIAEQAYGRQLADVDPLHGGAEAFLTLANLVVVLGFLKAPAPEDGGSGG
ncbi:DUF3593 domain-containing protein [Cyanobium sp. PCC 7001]|uniref:DUF3593 domain-containing protein n=1 Tax=Cyanobium sp. PCC 7001 TaxID=180281 RepID=UPI00067FB1B1|nr:DUF3593 domain-containing protein [Cyanobium sp. PCC 7001]